MPFAFVSCAGLVILPLQQSSSASAAAVGWKLTEEAFVDLAAVSVEASLSGASGTSSKKIYALSANLVASVPSFEHANLGQLLSVLLECVIAALNRRLVVVGLENLCAEVRVAGDIPFSVMIFAVSSGFSCTH